MYKSMVTGKDNMTKFLRTGIRLHEVSFPLVLGLLVGCLLILHLFAAQCFGVPEPAKGKNSDSFKVSPKVKEFEERLNKLLSPITYTYSPAGKPDPFQPFLRTKPVQTLKKADSKTKHRRPGRCSTPLECMDVGQLRLVAIVIEDNGKNLAMAQDASGVGYVLTPGMAVGYRNGHVKQILPDRVVVEEETENIRGEMTMTERVLFLHPEEK